MRLAKLLGLFALLVMTAMSAFGQRGKIAGVVTDAATGETIPGVNIVIDGTQQGTSSDADGYYFVLARKLHKVYKGTEQGAGRRVIVSCK